MAILHVKAATHNSDPDTVGTPDTPGSPYGLQGMLDSVAPNDEVIVWGDAVYDVSVTLLSKVSASPTSTIRISGANASGVIDGSKPSLISTISFIGDYLLFQDHEDYQWQYLTFDGAGQVTDTVYARRSVMAMCLYTGAIDDGFHIRSGDSHLVGCEAYGNGRHGFDFSPAGVAFFQTCYSHDNGSDGFQSRIANFVGCVAQGNGRDGFGESSGYINSYTNCIAYGNENDGFSMDGGPGNIINCSSVNNGGYGIVCGSGRPPLFAANNHTHGNTSGATNLAGGMPGTHNVTGDPLFADAANGDFTPGEGSPLINAGLGVST